MKVVPPVPVPIPFEINPTNAGIISAGLNIPPDSIKGINDKDDCMALNNFPDVPTELLGDVPFHRCYLEYTKKNSDATKKFCVSFMRNYIDNHRFEDIVDFIERGKQDKLLEYALLIGNGATQCFAGLVEKEEEYTDVILDCFGNFFKKNIVFGVASLLLFLF